MPWCNFRCDEACSQQYPLEECASSGKPKLNCSYQPQIFSVGFIITIDACQLQHPQFCWTASENRRCLSDRLPSWSARTWKRLPRSAFFFCMRVGSIVKPLFPSACVDRVLSCLRYRGVVIIPSLDIGARNDYGGLTARGE